jgi:DNA-directed RNA polymerase subunit beta'
MMYAVDYGTIELRTLVRYIDGDQVLETTPGRRNFQPAAAVSFRYVNKVVGAKELKGIIADIFAQFGPTETIRILDAIKETGYRYATVFAPTISIADIIIPEGKKEDHYRGEQGSRKHY